MAHQHQGDREVGEEAVGEEVVAVEVVVEERESSKLLDTLEHSDRDILADTDWDFFCSAVGVLKRSREISKKRI